MSAKVAPMIEAAEAGWNACRRQVYLLSEDYIERTHALKGGDTVEGNFYRGQYDVAKSFAKAFNAFEALDCDYFKQIDFSTLTNTSGDDEAPVMQQGRYWIEAEERWSNWIDRPVHYDWSDVKHEYRYLYARPQSAAVRDGWKPIETAPKDGSRILISHQYGLKIAWWGAAAYNRKTKSYDSGWTDGGNYGFVATHWMPLPPAPALHSTQEG